MTFSTHLLFDSRFVSVPQVPVTFSVSKTASSTCLFSRFSEDSEFASSGIQECSRKPSWGALLFSLVCELGLAASFHSAPFKSFCSTTKLITTRNNDADSSLTVPFTISRTREHSLVGYGKVGNWIVSIVVLREWSLPADL